MKALPHWLTHGVEELQSCVAASNSNSALLICVMQKAASDHIEVLLQFIYNYRNSDEVMGYEVLFICVSVCVSVFVRDCILCCPHFVKAFYTLEMYTAILYF